MSSLNTPQVKKLIRLAIEEDYHFGDITAELTVPAKLKSKASIIAREKLVVCGTNLVELIAEEFKFPVSVTLKASDGEVVKKGGVIAVITGHARHLLALERTVLNFLQRLSGVATHTRAIVEAAKGLTVLDTRKTTPGYRVLEKYATKIGGAKNHRMSLGDMILVKNNHIDANGGDLAATLARVMTDKPAYMAVEVEVRNLDELKTALPFCPQIVMLDNFSDSEVKKAIRVVRDSQTRPLIEVSGGITAARFPKLKQAGVEFVSMGRLTTQARNVDISMRIELGSSR